MPFCRDHKTIIGMVHLPPLPGTPFHREGDFQDLLDRAVRSACALHQNGADGCLVQTADRVYPVDDVCDPARLAAVALIVNQIMKETGPDFMIGVQIMRNALQASLAAAKVAGGCFIRAGAIVGQTFSPQGLVTPDALGLMNYRQQIGATKIGIIADIHSMHFRWVGDGRPVGQIARLALQAGADAVCLGEPEEAATVGLIDEVRSAAPEAFIVLAGYTDLGNAARLLRAADAAFVGAALERDGWGGEIDPDRVRAYVGAVRDAYS